MFSFLVLALGLSVSFAQEDVETWDPLTATIEVSSEGPVEPSSGVTIDPVATLKGEFEDARRRLKELYVDLEKANRGCHESLRVYVMARGEAAKMDRALRSHPNDALKALRDAKEHSAHIEAGRAQGYGSDRTYLIEQIEAQKILLDNIDAALKAVTSDSLLPKAIWRRDDRHLLNASLGGDEPLSPTPHSQRTWISGPFPYLPEEFRACYPRLVDPKTR